MHLVNSVAKVIWKICNELYNWIYKMQILHQSYDPFATTLSLATYYKVHWMCSKTTINFTSASLVAVAGSKGQLISKGLFGVFNFLKKTNKNKSHCSKIEFLRSFFGGNVGLKKSFRFCLTFNNPQLSSPKFGSCL